MGDENAMVTWALNLVRAERMARSGVPGSGVGLPSREADGELRPYGLRGQAGRRGFIDQMLLHPRIGTGVRNLRTEMQRQGVVWTPQDAEDPAQARFVELLTSMVDAGRIVTDATDEGSGWSDLMSWLVDEWVYGFALANWTWTTRDGELCLEVYPVMPSTIQRWRPSEDRSTWVAIEQRTDLSSAVIPRDRLLYVRTQGAPAEWEGVSILRPQLFGFETWRESSKAILMIMAAASGLVRVSGPKGGSDTSDWLEIQQQLIEWEQGRRRTVMHESGYEIDFAFPAAGAVGGLVEVLEYWDSQIDYGLAQSMQSLGFSSNGSRALGEELAEESGELRRASLETLLHRFGRSLARVVAQRTGYVGPLPVLDPIIERRREVNQRVTTIAQAVGAGLLRWTPSREAELAEELDLAEAAPVQASSCCPHVRMSAETMKVSGADGVEFDFYRPLTAVESSVAWGEVERIHLDAGADLERRVNEEAARHRARLWQVLPADSPELPRDVVDGVQGVAKVRYADVIQAYAISLAGEVARQSAAERHRQIQPDGSRAYVMPSTETIDDILAGRVQALIQRAADVIASRVWGEVETFWSGGGQESGFSSRQPALYKEALPVGQAIESKGRIVEAYSNAPSEGVVPVEAIRTAIRDGALCAHCRSKDGTRFDLTTADGIAEMLAMPLPDPECEGGAERCRCGLVVRYARLEGEELQAYLGVARSSLG